MIADDSGALSIAGVMGGAASGCTEATVNVFLEIAYWDPMRTAHDRPQDRHPSDARYRFERGVDPAFDPARRGAGDEDDPRPSAAASRAGSKSRAAEPTAQTVTPSTPAGCRAWSA